VDAFAQFVERLKGRVFKEVCFYGFLDARSNAWHANGCLFDDLARRFGTEGAPEQGLLVRMPEGDWEQQRVEKKAQLLVLTREQQRVAHAQLKVREKNLFRASQPLVSPHTLHLSKTLPPEQPISVATSQRSIFKPHKNRTASPKILPAPCATTLWRRGCMWKHSSSLNPLHLLITYVTKDSRPLTACAARTMLDPESRLQICRRPAT
jgi:hypothetical protein